MNKRVLVIGRGFLGNHIVNECERQRLRVFSTYYNQNPNDNSLQLDVTNINSINDCVSKIWPDLIINCASNIQIDFVEKNPETAFLVNSAGAQNVAAISTRYKIRLIHISTDSVFDGKKGMYSEEDVPNPINVYAKSKLLGEQQIKKNSDNYVIVRTNFYGFDKKGNFLFNWILSNLKQHRSITGFSDVIFTPLEISNLSKLILEISEKNYNGIIHLASDVAISKYQFAKKIAEVFNLDSDLIKKDSVDNYKEFVAKRPKNTSLSNRKSLKLLDTKIVPLEEWLEGIKERI